MIISWGNAPRVRPITRASGSTGQDRWSYVRHQPGGAAIVGELELGSDGTLTDRPVAALGARDDGVLPSHSESAGRVWGRFGSPVEVESFFGGCPDWSLGSHRPGETIHSPCPVLALAG